MVTVTDAPFRIYSSFSNKTPNEFVALLALHTNNDDVTSDIKKVNQMLYLLELNELNTFTVICNKIVSWFLKRATSSTMLAGFLINDAP